MVFASLPFFEKWYENLPKWESKNWCHGNEKNKGKQIAHLEQWKKINEHLHSMEVAWLFNPKGATHASVLKNAQSMALLPSNK